MFLYRSQDEGVAQIKGVCSRFNLWIKGACLLLGVATQTFNPSTMEMNHAGVQSEFQQGEKRSVVLGKC